MRAVAAIFVGHPRVGWLSFAVSAAVAVVHDEQQ